MGISDALSTFAQGGSLLPVAASLFSDSTNNHAGRDQRQMIAAANRSAILDKVAAAKEAGISPLYALGAPTLSTSSAVGSPAAGGGNLGGSLASMGQDISRALAAGQSEGDRQLQALALDKAALENEYLRAQINSVRVRTAREVGPPMPKAGGVFPEKPVEPQRTTNVNVGGSSRTNPYFMDAQSWEDRYGDSELLSMVSAVVNGIADLWWANPRGDTPAKQFSHGRTR